MGRKLQAKSRAKSCCFLAKEAFRRIWVLGSILTWGRKSLIFGFVLALKPDLRTSRVQ